MVKIVKQISAKVRISLIKKLEAISIRQRAKTVYRYRFGLKDGITKSNAKTGKRFGITGEAVRLIIKEVESLF